MFQIKTYTKTGNLLMTYTTSAWYEVQYQLLGVFNNPNIQHYEVYRDSELLGKVSR